MYAKSYRRLMLFCACFIASFVIVVAAAANVSGGALVIVKNVVFRGGEGSTVKLSKVEGAEAVAVDGATAVIGFEKLIELAQGKAALTSCTFSVRTIDKGAHRLTFGFGKLGVVNLTEGETDGVLLPKFASATSYSAHVYQKGKATKSFSGLTKPLTLADFDGVHAGEIESVSFELSFAKEKKDAWSVTLTHGDTTVVLTPEGAVQSIKDSPDQIMVQTTGVEGGFVLIREAVTVSKL